MKKLQQFRKKINRKLDEIFKFLNFVLSLKIKQIVLKHYKVLENFKNKLKKHCEKIWIIWENLE